MNVFYVNEEYDPSKFNFFGLSVEWNANYTKGRRWLIWDILTLDYPRNLVQVDFVY